MNVYPNAKLNLGLFVTGRRPDGYHLLETAFFPVPLCDELELELTDAAEDELIVTGGVETGELQDNLVLRAVRALRRIHSFPSLRLRLTKHIPSGAGMGGGSADASFTLTAVNKLCALGCSPGELEAIALTLGADCPVFVRNAPAVGRGIGEELTPIALDKLHDYHLSIVKPPIHISTAEAFRGLLPPKPVAIPIEELLARPVEEWRHCLLNDFEASLFPHHPILSAIKDELYALGADFALMTGSGAALYALSHQPLPLNSLRQADYFLYQGKL